ncbi:uncharacterized protein DUF695 [Aquabacterium commune]|uniref:Uncharacterized protein DUF695 n=1 Tax=Aquabacterium commune TaxID=70586 RepID=A0A4R6R8D9_9BURK|nr:uncharacterized protein DUF695 [Aquabacterium commune]
MKPIVTSLLLFVSLTLGTGAFAQTWATAQSRNPSNGRVIVFRYVQTFASGFSKAQQPIRVIVTWQYTSENGMPTPAERQRMDALEDLLAPAVEATGVATLALVSTGEGLREWTYYAKSEQVFLGKVNQALQRHPKFPIDIHVAQDKAWRTYEQFVQQVQKP